MTKLLDKMAWRNTIERLKNVLYYLTALATGNDIASYHIDKLDYTSQLVTLGSAWAHFLPQVEFLTEVLGSEELMEEIKSKYDVLPQSLMQEVKSIVDKYQKTKFIDADDSARLAELIADIIEKY